MSPAIETRDLVEEYGELRALQGLSLTVETGEFFGLLGPNGAGKTTFIETLVGLDCRSVRQWVTEKASQSRFFHTSKHE